MGLTPQINISRFAHLQWPEGAREGFAMSMQKWLLCVLFVAAACGGNNDNKIKFVDSNIDSDGPACDVLHQTGCAASEKCTWIIDQATPTRLGHIGCAPQGDK